MALYVNGKELANALDLSERRINQLVSEGTLEKGNDWKYNVYFCDRKLNKARYAP